MEPESAQRIYHRGLSCLRQGQTREAMTHFEASVHEDRRANPTHPDMRYRSYYGLCLALLTHRRSEAYSLCRQAVKAAFYNPDMFWNVGRVALLRGDRKGAVQAFRKGLKIDPHHQGLQAEMRRLGARQAPLFRSLPRGHLLNRFAGQLRSHLAGPAPA